MRASVYNKHDEQEQKIAEWMADNNLTTDDVTAPISQIKPRPWRDFTINAVPKTIKQNQVANAEIKPQLPKAEKTVEVPPVKKKRKDKQPYTKPKITGNYEQFTGVYKPATGENIIAKIGSVLKLYGIVDIDIFLKQQPIAIRQTFLSAAKKMEKAGLLRIIKSNEQGKPAKYLERIA